MSTHERETDEVTGMETTGHEWDGVKELNSPLPRWWLSIFYATVIWGILFTIAYPAWPMLTDATKGFLGYSTRAELAETMAAAEEAQASWRNQIAEAELVDIVANEELSRFATRAGEAAFAVNCSQCHGSGAQGFVGYPNLNDDDWIWGGTLEEIHWTIAHGVRNDTDFDARWSEMPAYGEIFEEGEIAAVANYVLSLSNLEHDASVVGDGAVLFEENCAACHGDAGDGMAELGAPNLSDAIWLFGGDIDAVTAQITNPSHGVMPAWGQRLDPVTVKELAVYVHGLGGGQ